MKGAQWKRKGIVSRWEEIENPNLDNIVDGRKKKAEWGRDPRGEFSVGLRDNRVSF